MVKKGYVPWNKGLSGNPDSTNYDPRIKQYGEAGSKTIKKQFQEGRKVWNKGKTKENDPGVAKISESSKGRASPFKGVPRSEEVKNKISESLKKHIRTPEHQRNLNESITGRKLTKEHRENISKGSKGHKRSKQFSINQSGKNNPFYGKNHNEKARKTMSEKAVQRLGSYPKTNTDIEIILQNQLKNKGIQFKTDFPVESISKADIFIDPNICIFADGNYWHDKPEVRDRDKRQTKKLQDTGYIVLRFLGSEIKSHPEECLRRILEIL